MSFQQADADATSPSTAEAFQMESQGASPRTRTSVKAVLIDMESRAPNEDIHSPALGNDTQVGIKLVPGRAGSAKVCNDINTEPPPQQIQHEEDEDKPLLCVSSFDDASAQPSTATNGSAAMTSELSCTMTPSSSSSSSSGVAPCPTEPELVDGNTARHSEEASVSAVSESSISQPQSRSNLTVPKRQRIPRACDACRRKKIRCNLANTDTTEDSDSNQSCATCHQCGTPCTFTKSPAKRGPNKGYIQQLETRLAALESSVSDSGPESLLSGSGSRVSDGGTRGGDTSISSRTSISRLRSHDIGAVHSGPLHSSSYSHPHSESHYLYHSHHHHHQNHLFPMPPYKKARTGQMPPPHDHDGSSNQQAAHRLYPIPLTHPFSSRTPTNEIWSRTTAPPNIQPSGSSSTNAFFLASSGSGSSHYPPPHPRTLFPLAVDGNKHSARAAHPLPAESAPPRNVLPSISNLLSNLPPASVWTGLTSNSRDERKNDGQEDQRSTYPASTSRLQNEQPLQCIVDARPGSRHASPNLPTAYDAPRSTRPHSLSTSSSSTYRSEQYQDEPARRRQRYHTNLTAPEIATSPDLSRSYHSTPKSVGTTVRVPTSATASPVSGSSSSHQGRRDESFKEVTPLSRLSDSAVISFDKPSFRKALFNTPALRTFSILPPNLLGNGLDQCLHLIKAAHLLSAPTASSWAAQGSSDGSQWERDLSSVVGECMMPMRFDDTGGVLTFREIETLMMCYVDALRRGKLIPGILGAVSGKLAILETRGLPCKRYQAVGILLAVWHTVGYSSRRMYFGTPSISGPEALYSALGVDDPILLAICCFTYNMDRICRRYCQNGETFVSPETIASSVEIAEKAHIGPLPESQHRLLVTLDAYLIALNFTYNQSADILPSLANLEGLRHSLHKAVNDAEHSGILDLLVGPHVLALVACASLYCLTACQEKAEAHLLANEATNLQIFERDYLAILDGLRDMSTSLSTDHNLSLVNGRTSMEAGDMRLLYGEIAHYVDANLSTAAASSSQLKFRSSSIISSLHSMGYLGTILAFGQSVPVI